jgi:hypothetical protein
VAENPTDVDLGLDVAQVRHTFASHLIEIRQRMAASDFAALLSPDSRAVAVLTLPLVQTHPR